MPSGSGYIINVRLLQRRPESRHASATNVRVASLFGPSQCPHGGATGPCGDARNPMPPADTTTGHLLHGKALFENRNYPQALEEFAAARRQNPGSPEILARLATTCAQMENWPAAEATWRELLAINPNLPVAKTGLGIALREQGRLAAALAVFQETADSHPSLAAAHSNLGICLMRCDQPAAAQRAFKHALALQPDSGKIRFDLALALLKAGNFKNGALAYQARWKAEWKGKERPFTSERWAGATLAPRTSLALWGEQGIGDEIMFAGLIPAAFQVAAGMVLLECTPRLVPLFARAFPGIQVVERVNPPDAALTAAALNCPTGALPGLLWPTDSAPVAPPPYLRADPTKVDQMRAALATLEPGRKIGIAWRGGHPAAKRPRFIPAEAWRPLLESTTSSPSASSTIRIPPS